MLLLTMDEPPRAAASCVYYSPSLSPVTSAYIQSGSFIHTIHAQHLFLRTRGWSLGRQFSITLCKIMLMG